MAALMDGDRKRAERLRVEEERLRCSSQEARMAMVGLGLMCRGILV